MLDAPPLAHGGVNNWGAAFLPAYCQGTPIGNASTVFQEETRITAAQLAVRVGVHGIKIALRHADFFSSSPSTWPETPRHRATP